jgi:hypothetical protein
MYDGKQAGRSALLLLLLVAGAVYGNQTRMSPPFGLRPDWTRFHARRHGREPTRRFQLMCKSRSFDHIERSSLAVGGVHISCLERFRRTEQQSWSRGAHNSADTQSRRGGRVSSRPSPRARASGPDRCRRTGLGLLPSDVRCTTTALYRLASNRWPFGPRSCTRTQGHRAMLGGLRCRAGHRR